MSKLQHNQIYKTAVFFTVIFVMCINTSPINGIALFANHSGEYTNRLNNVLTNSDTTGIICPNDITTYTDLNSCSSHISSGLSIQAPSGIISSLTWEITGATNSFSPSSGINQLTDYVFNEGTTIVTYQGKDRYNNTIFCNFTVTVVDNQLPRLENPQEDIIVKADLGDCFAKVDWADPIVFDNCASKTQLLISSNYVPGSSFPVGITEVVYSINDGVGYNNTQPHFFVTVVDEEAPEIFAPPPSIVKCGDAIPDAFTSWQQFNNAGGMAFDNCNIDYSSFRYAKQKSSGIRCPYTITRTYSIADKHGNSSEVEHIIRVIVDPEHENSSDEKQLSPTIADKKPQNEQQSVLKSGMAIFTAQQTGDWNDSTTWGGAIPTSNDNVIIPAGIIITVDSTSFCSDITIDGSINYNGSDTLTVYGDWSNNGTYDAGTAGLVEFAGTSSATINGTTNFEGLIVNKGSLSTLLTINGTVEVLSGGKLTMTSGLLTIPDGANLSISPAIRLDIESTAGFDVTGGTLTTGNFTIYNQGLIRVNAGTASFGDSAGNSVETSVDGTFIVTGGMVNIAGRLHNSAGGPFALGINSGINISGGTVNLATIGNGLSDTGALNVTARGAFSFTGGRITIENANSTSGISLDLQIAEVDGQGIKNITNGIFQFGAGSTTGETFVVSSLIPIPNIETNNNSDIVLASDIEVSNQLSLNGSSHLLLDGNSIKIPVVMSGTYTFYGKSSADPITVNFTGGTYAGASLEIEIVDAKHPNNLNSNHFLNKYWILQTRDIANPTYNVSSTYTASDIAHAASQLIVGNYASGWSEISGASVASNTASFSSSSQNLSFTVLEEPTVTITNADPEIICDGASLALTTSASGGSSLIYSWSPSNYLTDASSPNPVATPPASPANTISNYTYTVTVTDGNGFTASDAIGVIVNPIPTVSATPASQQICPGGTLTQIHISNPNNVDETTFTWSRDNTSTLTGIAASGSGNSISGTFNSSNPSVLETTIFTITATANGCSSQTTVSVIVGDNEAPIATVSSLPNATGECSVTVTAPTATDNCSGFITGTTSDPFTYSTQGTYTVTWNYNDGNGNTSTQTQTIIIDDITNPATPTLADVTGECTATAVAPTTTDNCAGTITGTTTDALTYTTQGTHVITWNFDDGNGNAINVNQNVIIDDVTNPATPTLADVTGECTATAVAPTTTDNCAGTITGTTTDALTYTTQGTHVITWNFDDGNGNAINATQNVIIDDVTNPATPTLADITGECTATAVAPTTTDNCAGTITGTSTDPLTYTTQGTHVITWNFDDGNGNAINATQKVIIDDVSPPIPLCQDITIQLDAFGNAAITSAAINNGSSDNCTPDEDLLLSLDKTSFTCSDIGTNTVTLSVSDASGNSSSCSAIVSVEDNIAPIAMCQDYTIQLDASGSATISPTDIDNGSSDACGIKTLALDITDFNCTNLGDNTVILTVTDNNDNTSTCSATVTITDNPQPIATAGGTASICSYETATVSGATATNGTIAWTHNGQGSISNQTTSSPTYTANSADAGNTVTLTMTVTGNNVCGSNTATATFTIIVHPEPVGTDGAYTTCSNVALTYELQDQITNSVPSDFSWTVVENSNITGESAASGDNITQTLRNLTNTPQDVVYTVTPSSEADNCTGEAFAVTITVNPEPVGTDGVYTTCSNVELTYDLQGQITNSVPSSFSWTVAENSNITGESAASGDFIIQTLRNLTNTPQDVVYTVTPSSEADNCDGEVFTVTITVNPEPVGTDGVYTTCSNVELAYDLQAQITNSVPSNFSWTVVENTNVTGESAASGDFITQTLRNLTNTPQDVVYTVTPSSQADNCTGEAFAVTITVNPEPVGINGDYTTCSEVPLAYNLQGQITNSVPSNFSWTVVENANISGGSTASGDFITQTLTNLTPIPQDLVYIITPSSKADNCDGEAFAVTITINPTPMLSTTTDTTICTGVEFLYTPESLTPGTTFSWIRKAALGINNSAASALHPGEINETLVNTTDSEKPVIYTYTLTANGCINVQNLVVNVSPAPLLSSNENPPAICSGTPFVYTATSNLTNDFTWSRASIAGISEPENLNNNTAEINETLTNTSNADIDVAYEISMNVAGCENTQTVWATIKAVPTVNLISSNEYCAGDMVPEEVVSSLVANTSFSWTNDNPAIGLAGYGTGNIPSFTATNTTDAPIVATITITPRAKGCSGVDLTYTITVYPSPAVSPVNTINMCFNASHAGINFSSPTTGSTLTYNWTSTEDLGFGTSGTGNIPAFTATNADTAIVTVTAVDQRNCSGAPTQFELRVRALPQITTLPLAPEICAGDGISITASGADTYTWSPSTGLNTTNGATVNASPASTTTYTITGSDDLGCESTTTVTVSVNELPNVSISAAAPLPLCFGESIELTAHGADTYTWSPATGLDATSGLVVNANPTSTTEYIVVGTHNTCTNTDTLLLTVEPLPVLSNNPSPVGLCSGSEFNYIPTSTTASIFRWSREAIPGGTSENADTLAVGDAITEVLILDVNETNSVSVVYTIELETPDGCINTEQVTIEVSPEPQLIGSSDNNVCSGDVFYFAPTTNAGASISWSRAAITGISAPALADQSGAISEILINTTTTSIEVTYVFTLNLNGCEIDISKTVNVLPGPNVSASSSAMGAICPGHPFDLYSSTTVLDPPVVTLLPGDFTNSSSDWSTNQASTEGDEWTRQADGYFFGILHSNDNSTFFIANNIFYSGITSTTLTSRAIDISSGYSSLYLEFYHHFYYNGVSETEKANVEVSTDNTNWTALATYSSTQGESNDFDTVRINLDSYLSGSPSNLYVRFKYDAIEGYWWAIDNVSVKASTAASITWTAGSDPTIISNQANPTNITQTETTTYYARYAFFVETGFSCDGVASVTVETLEDTEAPVLSNIPGPVTFSCEDCIQAFSNADFEGNQSINGWQYVAPGGVPGWASTTTSGVIEIQESGRINGVVSQSGNYHAELNADRVGNFYQEFCTVPTTTVEVSFWHHKRTSTINTSDDIMAVSAGPNLSSLTQLYTATATDNSGWTKHTVQLDIPVGQISTVFSFSAIQGAPSNNTYGNLIDNINAVTLFGGTISPTATDNCDGTVDVIQNDSTIDGECSSNYTLIRTWTATDMSGNSDTATQIVTVGDFDAPVLSITPNNITVECDDPGFTVTIDDNCAPEEDIIVTRLADDTIPGDCPHNYELIRSWDAVDLCNNRDTFYQHIYFDDTTPPVFSYVPADATLTCTETSEEIATATDYCGEVEITFEDNIVVGSCYGELTRYRTWIATDDCGNFAEAEQIIQNHDITPPTWTSAVGAIDTTINCNSAEALTAAQAMVPLGFDDCDTTTLVPIKTAGNFIAGGDCSLAGTYTNTFIVTDDCGNTSVEYTQTITVIDSIAPLWVDATGDLDTTLECGDATALAEVQSLFPIALDNCDADVTNLVKTSGTFVQDATACDGSGTYTNTWTVTDECGNTSPVYTQLISIEDTTPPSWITTAGALNVILSCDDATAIATAQAQQPIPQDNCDANPNSVKTSHPFVPGICEQSGTFTNTWTIMDNCGNEGEIFTQIITLEDFTEPDIHCPANVTLNYGESTDPNDTGFATAMDNCDPDPALSYTNDTIPGNCVYKFEIRRTWLAIDACGNESSCKQSIYVQDIEEPAIACTIVGDTTVEANNGETYIHAGIAWDAIITDNSNHPIIEVSLTGATNAGPFATLNGIEFNEGLTTVTWNASDSCDNIADPCSYTVTVTTSADLEITKVANTDPVNTGEELIYTLTATNNGTSVSPTTTISDVVTAFTNPEYALSVNGPWSIWTGNYTLPSPLPINTSYQIFIRGTIATEQCSDVRNTAQVSGNKRDPDLLNNKVTINTTVVDTIAPEFTVAAYENCVDPLHYAIYNPSNPSPVFNHLNPNLDKSPIDYRTLFAGDTFLDVLTMNDNCCNSEDLTIYWRIEFSDTKDPISGAAISHSNIEGSGQPSTYVDPVTKIPSDIYLWGDGILFTTALHHIYYWLTDCNGNTSEEVMREITISPRPQVIKEDY